MKKRILSLLLASLMVVGCLVGCGKTDTKETEKSESKTESKVEQQETTVKESSEPVKEEELEEKTIQVMLFGPGKQKDADKVWAAFNDLLQEYVPNTTVEFTWFPSSEYKEKFNQMLASGEPVDLAWAGYCSPSQDSLVADGSIIPLNDLLDEYGQDIKEILGEKVLDMGTYPDGNIYYTISWQGLFANKWGFFVPKEFAELAGPTWLEDTRKIVADFYATSTNGYDLEKYQACYDQFAIYLQALKDKDMLYSGTAGLFNAPQIKNIDSFNMHKNSVGIAKGDNTFKVIDLIDTEHYRFYAKNQADYYQRGFIRSDIASVELNSMSFLQKDNTGKLTPNAQVIRYHNLFNEAEVEKRTKEFGMELVGIECEDNGYLNQGKETSMVIPYCADEPERGMMVLNAIYANADLYNMLVYGLEGEHYTTNPDGTIVIADKHSTSTSNYGLNNWIIGTCANGLVTQKQVPGYYEGLVELEKDAKVSPFLKFIFDPSPVADVVSALTAVDGEYENMIQYGYTEDWEATLDKWIAERKAAGVDKLIAEYQKQIDAFVKENNITSW